MGREAMLVCILRSLKGKNIKHLKSNISASNRNLTGLGTHRKVTARTSQGIRASFRDRAINREGAMTQNHIWRITD